MPSDLVLIVDDNEGVRSLLKEVSMNNGYQVEVASNGAEAIKKFHKCVPSVILLDSKMPGMNSLKVAEKVKDLFPELPIIMISAYSEQEDIKVAQQKGLINFCVSKPFDINKMVESIRLLIHTY
ncbi:response regulator [Desulfosporosinus nitroreducens]|uniref:response regulator n=1 Tax=Desulfosporosinus nitroreducens TaxID=2018668 RepID=UPI00207D6DE8|nr:response regulator [Desulfosporosinus nitroreducens]MCO1602424.1 response regulator [Desulfosporosinus nitroreducens]